MTTTGTPLTADDHIQHLTGNHPIRSTSTSRRPKRWRRNRGENPLRKPPKTVQISGTTSIDGQEQLEKELISSDATSIIVSHDRAFLRNVGTRFWQIKRKRLEEVDSPEDFIANQLNTSAP